MVSSNRKRDPQAMTCSTCGRRFLIDETPAPPFCSERCQLIDLGRWLDEEIGLPHEGDPGEAPVEYRDEAVEYRDEAVEYREEAQLRDEANRSSRGAPRNAPGWPSR